MLRVSCAIGRASLQEATVAFGNRARQKFASIVAGDSIPYNMHNIARTMSPPAKTGVGPLTDQHAMSDGDAKAAEHRLRDRQIRLLPYPFGSALAIVSDVDGSSRERYRGYVGLLVEELGLDFGDSTWLRWKVLHDGDVTKSNGFGFFSRHLNTGGPEDAAFYRWTRTFNENVAEYHKGNVDHFHSFSSRGPRVAVGRHFAIERNTVRLRVGDMLQSGLWAAADCFVFAICVVGKPGASLTVEDVRIVDAHGNAAGGLVRSHVDVLDDGRQRVWFMHSGEAAKAVSVPAFFDVREVRVTLGDSAEADNVEWILLSDGVGQLILDRLRFLRERFNVCMSLVTEHGAYHTRNPNRGMVRNDASLKEHLESASEANAAYNGMVRDANGHLIFATDSHDPHSIGRVFPELSRELDCRFVVPAAASKAFGWNPFQLLAPTPTLSGGGLYWARRMVPNLSPPQNGNRFDGTRTKQATFGRRLGLVLDYARDEPGLCYPVYTHLGRGEMTEALHATAAHTIEADEGVLATFDRYLESAPLLALQDRAFNISGTVPERDRMWVTRASVLYDYALVLRGIADHVTRPSANEVHIASWFDDVLETRLPVSAAQLYGLTFYVDDAAAARVLLDGKPIEHLVRNPPDETGRPSVTVAACEIVATVFNSLDPFAAGEEGNSEAGWSWTAGDEPFGRLSASSTGPVSRTFAMHGWSAAGSQAFTVKVRRHGGAHFGIVVTTADGAQFYFGSAGAAGSALPRARYIVDEDQTQNDTWATIVIPFWCLDWSEGAKAGGVLPSHALQSIAIRCDGPEASHVDIAQMAFLRPRATSAIPSHLHCLGGSVQPFSYGQHVHAVRVGSEAETRTVPVDPQGFFCFDNLEPGIYRVWSDHPTGVCLDRRGPLAEVVADTMTLDLGRWSPDA